MHCHFPGYHSCSQPQGTLLAKTWKGPSLLGILSGCSHRQGDGPVPPHPPAPVLLPRCSRSALACLANRRSTSRASLPALTWRGGGRKTRYRKGVSGPPGKEQSLLGVSLSSPKFQISPLLSGPPDDRAARKLEKTQDLWEPSWGSAPGHLPSRRPVSGPAFNGQLRFQGSYALYAPTLEHMALPEQAAGSTPTL